MRIGCSTWNFEEELAEGKMDLFEMIKEIKNLGFTSVEIMSYHISSIEDEYLAKLVKHVDDLGMTITALDVRNQMFGGKWFEFRRDVAMIKFWANIASKIKCPKLVVFPGPFETEEQREFQVGRDIEGIKECVQYGEKIGVGIAIENHRIYGKPGLLENEDEAGDIIKIVKAINSKYCGACPDSNNFYKVLYSESTPEQQAGIHAGFERMAEFAMHAHIKVKNFDENGNSLQNDFNKLIGSLKKYGYQGDIAFELMKPVEDKNGTLKSAVSLVVKELKAAGIEV